MNRLLGLLVIVGSFAVGWFLIDFGQFRETPLNTGEEGRHLVVAPGSNLMQVADSLARDGVLGNPDYLVLLARWQGKSRRIQAGEYQLAFGITPDQLLDQLTRGSVMQHSLTLIEGWNFRQVMAAVRAHEALRQTTGDPGTDEIMARLGAPGMHPEGRFFPDTYRFPRGTSDVEFLKRAYDAMDLHLAEIWEKRPADTPLKNAYEALILASIVEKETGQADERIPIASVFLRRLRKGMRLQTDPTVIYGLGETFDGNIRRRDLQRDTPYNTYTRGGLPPTPIAMPGKESLEAVVQPEQGTALYFVAKGNGRHQFSATLEQHNQAVRKYQLGGR